MDQILRNEQDLDPFLAEVRNRLRTAELRLKHLVGAEEANRLLENLKRERLRDRV